MKVAVWDTYVPKKEGGTMHFDILVPDHITDEAEIQRMGKEYLTSKGQENQPLTASECNFCHIESATMEIEVGTLAKGYYIIEMEGC